MAASKYKWNLTPLYKNDSDPQMLKDRKISEQKVTTFIKKWKDREDYLEDSKILSEALNEYEELYATYGIIYREGFYWHLRASQEEDNTEIKANINKLHDITIKLGNEMEFFSIKLSKISEEKQREFLESPDLKEYKNWLKNLFSFSKYILSEKEERIANLLWKTSFGNWIDMVSRFLSKAEREIINEEGKKEKLPFNSIMGLLSSKNQKVLGSAGKAIDSITKEFAEVAENEINSVLEVKKTMDEVRGYDRPDRGRHLSDDIETEVVDTLVNTVAKRYDIAQRFYKLRAGLLGKKKLKYHERLVELTKVKKKFEYEQASNLVSRVFTELDPQFGNYYDDFIKNGQFDVFPEKGKSGGAFCSSGTSFTPVYILLNYTDTLTDVTTIAHEMGHAINFEMTKLVQNSLNDGVSTATTEVASTFFEDFVLQELEKEANEEEQLNLVVAKLDDEIATIFRQIAFYRFEQDLHAEFREKGYLPYDEIGKLFAKHLKDYLGDAVEVSKASENWWVYVNHFRNFFYVYSYASGLLISKGLQALVKENPDNMEKVKVFLSAGTSESPKNIFGAMGIDITDEKFWNKGLDEVEEHLAIAEKLAKKLGKI